MLLDNYNFQDVSFWNIGQRDPNFFKIAYICAFPSLLMNIQRIFSASLFRKMQGSLQKETFQVVNFKVERTTSLWSLKSHFISL